MIPTKRVRPSSRAAEDDLRRAGPLLEHLQVGDAVELVEVEVIAAQPFEGALEVGADTVGVRAVALAGHEQLVADGGHVGADEHLGVSVRGRDVEVVDACGQRRPEGLLGLVGRAAAERRRAEDGDGRLVAGAAETTTLHARSLPWKLREPCPGSAAGGPPVQVRGHGPAPAAAR